ncbi:MAG: NADH-quinone oxidoreductase subunit C [Elusimicrobiales bacterium]|nr:NADH-quinone oxidoreductase subunit C [Elusimicrobiales bacterium]
MSEETIKEEEIVKNLKEKFGDAIENVIIPRKNRVWMDINQNIALDLMKYLKEHGYYHLSTITGFDEGEKLGAIYHITDHKTILNIKIRTSKENPVLKSVLSVYPVATSYERELFDLFGIKVEGLPEGRNYPLPEGFPEGVHPLRKEVKLDELNKMLNEKSVKED